MCIWCSSCRSTGHQEISRRYLYIDFELPSTLLLATWPSRALGGISIQTQSIVQYIHKVIPIYSILSSHSRCHVRLFTVISLTLIIYFSMSYTWVPILYPWICMHVNMNATIYCMHQSWVVKSYDSIPTLYMYNTIL